MKSDFSERMEGNIFGGLGEAMMSSVQLQYGWVVLGIGCFILVITPFLQDKNIQETYAKEPSFTKQPISQLPTRNNQKTSYKGFIVFIILIGLLVAVVTTIVWSNNREKARQAQHAIEMQKSLQ